MTEADICFLSCNIRFQKSDLGVLPEATHLLIAERRQTQAETGKLHRLFPICLPHHGGTV